MESDRNSPVNTKPAALAWYMPGSQQQAKPLTILPCLLNIRNRPITPVDFGFGQFWEKIYQARLVGINVTPEEVVSVWKQNFSKFWPEGNLFFTPVEGITPGSIALLKLAIPGQKRPFLATGIVAEEVTPTSFTFTAFAGHPISGSMKFSAFRENGVTVAQAHARLRASDPLYEVAIRIAGKKEDEFWKATLKNIANHFGVRGEYSLQINCLDRRLHWSKAFNVRHNSAIHTIIYNLLFPFRFLKFAARGFRRKRS